MYENLKKLRESLKMTQADFGKSVGVAKSTYNNYETGIREPKSDFWISVASTYGVTIDYLMGFSDSPCTGKEIKKSSSEPDEVDLLSNYQKLNEEGKEYIRHQMAVALQLYSGECKIIPHLETK